MAFVHFLRNQRIFLLTLVGAFPLNPLQLRSFNTIKFEFKYHVGKVSKCFEAMEYTLKGGGHSLDNFVLAGTTICKLILAKFVKE